MGQRASLSRRKECPECGNQAFVRDASTGETVCAYCGLVLEERERNRGPEWRAFTLQEKSKRPRASPQPIDLPTYINPLDKDAFGRKISLSQRNTMFRLRKWQARSRYFDSVDRNLNRAQDELDRLSDVLHIPSQAKELAMSIYRESLEKRIVRGRSINAMIAASLAVACRKLQISRSLAEIAAKSMANKKEVARDFRVLLKKLGLRMPVHDLTMYIKKIGGNLELSEKTQYRAFQILLEAQDERIISGKGPKGLAAAALYIACQENDETRTQGTIAKEAGVTDVTIRNRYQDLKKQLKIELCPKSQKRRPTKPQPEENLLSQDLIWISQKLTSLSEILVIPNSTEDKALLICKKVLDGDLLLNQTAYTLALIALYTACQLHQFPEKAEEFSKIGKIEKEEIIEGYNVLVQELNLQIPDIETAIPTEEIIKDFAPSASTETVAS